MKTTGLPVIKTKRLLLRSWDKEDADDLFEYAKNPQVGPRAGWKPHDNREESKKIIESVFSKNLVWAMVLRKTDKVIGSIGLEKKKLVSDKESLELGYAMSEEFWNMGLMTEAAERAVEYAFDVMKTEMLIVKTFPDNTASQKVALKCGFSYEGELYGIVRDHEGNVRTVRCYTLYRDDYRKRRECDGLAKDFEKRTEEV